MTSSIGNFPSRGRGHFRFRPPSWMKPRPFPEAEMAPALDRGSKLFPCPGYLASIVGCLTWISGQKCGRSPLAQVIDQFRNLATGRWLSGVSLHMHGGCGKMVSHVKFIHGESTQTNEAGAAVTACCFLYAHCLHTDALFSPLLFYSQ